MKMRYGKMGLQKKCVICDANTLGSRVYEEWGISIRIPICDRADNDCQGKVFVKDTARAMLEQLKQEVTQ